MGKLAFVLAVPIALLATVASLGLVVVDVREGGPNGHHLVVPVPLVFAQAAVAVAPAIVAEKVKVVDEKTVRQVAAAREVLEALAAAPDGELVRVEERDEQVVVRKEGRSLRVRVHDASDDVSVNVPLRLALSALPDARGRLRGVALASALGATRFTDLVDVRDGRDHVRVYVW